MTTCMEPMCDLREGEAEKYVTITYREAGETVREQHWIFPPTGTYPYTVQRWDVRTYLPGRGVYQVGNRLRYVGKNIGTNRTGLNRYVDDVPVGTEATISRDFGYDYRFMLEFDNPTAMNIWSAYPEGEYQGRTGMRTSGSGWEKIA